MTIFFAMQGLKKKLILKITKENKDNRMERKLVLGLCRPMFSSQFCCSLQGDLYFLGLSLHFYKGAVSSLESCGDNSMG